MFIELVLIAAVLFYVVYWVCREVEWGVTHGRRKRDSQRMFCPGCGYHLMGVEKAICPGCYRDVSEITFGKGGKGGEVGVCRGCGYSLSGLKSDRCPECGERFV